MYSGFAAYSSGVKHQGKMPWITMSVVLSSASPWSASPARRPGGTVRRRPPAVERQRFHEPGCFAASHMPVAAPRDSPETWALVIRTRDESSDVVGEQFGGVGPVRLAGQPGATQVHRVTAEPFGVVSHLERVACLIGSQVRNEDQRLPFALKLVVDLDVVRLNVRHRRLPCRRLHCRRLSGRSSPRPPPPATYMDGLIAVRYRTAAASRRGRRQRRRRKIALRPVPPMRLPVGSSSK